MTNLTRRVGFFFFLICLFVLRLDLVGFFFVFCFFSVCAEPGFEDLKAMAAAAASTSSGLRCFNSNCKEPVERPRKGWRRRTGDFADLCDRCA